MRPDITPGVIVFVAALWSENPNYFIKFRKVNKNASYNFENAKMLQPNNSVPHHYAPVQ